MYLSRNGKTRRKKTQMSLRFTVFNSMHLPVSELDAAAVFQAGILDCRLVLGPFPLALQQRECSAVIIYPIGSKTSC